MKKLIATAMILLGSTAWSLTNNMPEGVYQGQGRWQDSQGQTGTYIIETSVNSGIVSSIYTFGGKTEAYKFKAVPGANGQFDVLIGGQKAGSGYCMKVQCHYDVSFGKTVLEETLTFYGGNLYRLGSKRIDDSVVTWEESMKKKGN